MKPKGPRSAASLSVVTALSPPLKRLQAPKHLGPMAAQVWIELVASRPPEFFDDGAGPLLETLAVATAEHRKLAALMDSLDPITDLDTAAKVTRMMDTHALRIGAAATKLRLSNQARYDAQKANTLRDGTGTPADRMRANYARQQ